MRITRKSDKFKLTQPKGLLGRALCPSCKEYLSPVKNDELNMICHTCGEYISIKSIKFDTRLTEVDREGSAVVQNKNARRGFKPRPVNPIEQELRGHGFQVIDSDYRDQRQ
jgi:hypothetical protein